MTEISYVSINGEDYLPKQEYEKIEKKRGSIFHFLVGLGNAAFMVGLPIAYIAHAHASEQGLIEVAKNLGLENLVFWTGLFILNSFGAYQGLSKAHQLTKELKND